MAPDCKSVVSQLVVSIVSIGLVAFGARVSLGSDPIESIPADAGSLEARVDAHLKPYIETGNFSGSVLIAREGSVLLSKSYGMANIKKQRPVDPGTSFYLASSSRIFTSAAILLLEQEGLLSVGDSVSTYLPDWPRGEEITIHHLLTLSAGFPNINELSRYRRWSQSAQTPASLCEKFRDLPLEFEPGEKTVHSNSNYNLLALLIEKISGMSYGDYLSEQFFEPLDMGRTAHDDHPDRAVPHRATGYAPQGRGELRVDVRADMHWSVKTGNGSIYSTPEDLYKFDRMLADKALLQEGGAAKTFTQHFEGLGYGWFVRERKGTTQVSIAGRSPGFGSSWIRLYDPDVTVIVCGNIYNGVPLTVGKAFMAMALGERVEPPTLQAQAPERALLKEYVGAYRFGPDFYRANGTVKIQVKGGDLFNNNAWLIPQDESTFVHRTYWSTLKFLRDESGRVDRLQYDGFTGVRVR